MGAAQQMLLGSGGPFQFTISSNQNDANLRTLALAAGWDGGSRLIAKIASGVVISATTTGGYALTINGSFPAGGRLINLGTAVGRGGNGGNGANADTVLSATAGAAGGPALLVSVPFEIDNGSGTLAGGGGGGGGGGSPTSAPLSIGGGGGGGGKSSNTNSSGGTGGPGTDIAGGNGGTGTLASAGSGGSSGGAIPPNIGGAGGSGGGWGSAGTAGTDSGNTGSPWHSGRPGGGAGNAVTGNSNITWIATGTRLGGIS